MVEFEKHLSGDMKVNLYLYFKFSFTLQDLISYSTSAKWDMVIPTGNKELSSFKVIWTLGNWVAP